MDVALAVAVVGTKLLVARREPGTHLEGHWEFPGGKLEAGEEPADAARRELTEETGLVATTLEPLSVFVHEYPDRTIRLHVFLARDPEGELAPGREWSWKELAELHELSMPSANAQILQALEWRV